jgi:predicted transposase YdaD
MVRGWLKMTKVEKIFEKEKEEAMNQAEKSKAAQIAKNLMDILSIEMIAKKTGLSIEEVEKLKADMSKN